MFNALIPELAVRDLLASLQFYRDVLGFAVAYERPEDGFAFLELGAAQLMLDQIGTGRDFGAFGEMLGQGLNLQITVPAIDPLLAALANAGIPLFLEREIGSYRRGDSVLLQPQFGVADPDGYVLRFCESPRVLPATPHL